MAGTSVPPIPMIPWSPNDQPVTSRWCPSRWRAWAGVRAPNCRSIAASQACPYRAGVCTSWSRLAPKVKAAVTASTDSVAPARTLRTGTAPRPAPGSSAKRAPVVTVTGAPALASDPASREWPPGRDGASPGPAARADARCQAGHAVQASSTTTIATAPVASTIPATLMPGSGSARRASPIGISGDAATATATAATAPAAPAVPTSTRPAAVSWALVIPSAASVGMAAAAAPSWRTAACPTISSVVTARTSAKSASAIASGRIARCTVAAWVPSSATKIWPPVPGNRRASACAWRAEPGGVVPGRRRTDAPSKPM